MQQQHGEMLHRGLKSRHIQLIALGGAIGTGFFLGSAQIIQSAGPCVILGYLIAGFIAFLIMRQLAEMVVEEPVSGSFSHFAYKYWGDFCGFISGWNYWVLYVLVAMTELIAIGKYVQFWFPTFPTWMTISIFFIAINILNLSSVKVFGELEFWFSIIKIVTIISILVFGSWLLLKHQGGSQASISNLWKKGGFMPFGIMGMIIVMPIIMFSFGGLELVGIAAAEADNPSESIPLATNQVLLSIIIFYIASLIIVLSILPWSQMHYYISPFVFIFQKLGIPKVADLLNIIILTAALSVYNSAVYGNSRMLFGLTKQGNAPKILGKLNIYGVPIITILISAIATGSCILVDFFIPGEAFGLLLSLVVSTLIINWSMISLTHIKFRKIMNLKRIEPKFKAIFYPIGNWICLIFMVCILGIMTMIHKMVISVLLIPIWLLILTIGYLVKKRLNKSKPFFT